MPTPSRFRSLTFLLASVGVLSACLGPLDPAYVDERGQGGRTVALYYTPWHIEQKLCVRSAAAPLLVATQVVSAQGSFSFPELKTGCYRVADVTVAADKTAPTAPALQIGSATWVNGKPSPQTLSGKTTVKDHGGSVMVRICHEGSTALNRFVCR